MPLNLFTNKFLYGLAPEGLVPPDGFSFQEDSNEFLQVRSSTNGRLYLVEIKDNAIVTLYEKLSEDIFDFEHPLTPSQV